MTIRLWPTQADEFFGPTPTLTVDDGADAWWSGAALSFAGVARASAAVLLLATQAAQAQLSMVQRANDERPTPVPVVDDDALPSGLAFATQGIPLVLIPSPAGWHQDELGGLGAAFVPDEDLGAPAAPPAPARMQLLAPWFGDVDAVPQAAPPLGIDEEATGVFPLIPTARLFSIVAAPWFGETDLAPTPPPSLGVDEEAVGVFPLVTVPSFVPVTAMPWLGDSDGTPIPPATLAAEDDSAWGLIVGVRAQRAAVTQWVAPWIAADNEAISVLLPFDEDNAVDPRLAGAIVVRHGMGGDLRFRIDVGAPGVYRLELALGRAAHTANAFVRGTDGDGADLFTIGPIATGIGEFVDATGTKRTSPANWVASQATRQITLTSTFLVLHADGVGNTADAAFAHVRLIPV